MNIEYSVFLPCLKKERKMGMGMGMGVGIALKSLFSVLGCVMIATLIYTIIADGHPFRIQLLTPWLTATLIDFYFNIVAIGAWVIYKESNWISAVLWVVLLICLGRNKPERQNKLCVAVAKVVFIALGCLMLGTLIYTFVTNGSPFRKEVYTPWTIATFIDFYINVVALSVWIVYKESSWISASCWILLLITLGSIATSAYIVLQLFQLSSQDPPYYILFNRAKEGYEGTLQEDLVDDC
ncbi:uncharacterized protein LOC116021031 isoform X2 [Ipomoea triloba]|uniref:uncharacterized protein LOC116021031 isoform X2 n=1 Tax=Ipomoea triloba TaxID=35885 RepID=UPI00125E18A9|nr:uncharacterized protein LOC116021031 isoform X2 [Ipomoea triloba]